VAASIGGLTVAAVTAAAAAANEQPYLNEHIDEWKYHCKQNVGKSDAQYDFLRQSVDLQTQQRRQHN
jgi:invasion protein IalB